MKFTMNTPMRRALVTGIATVAVGVLAAPIPGALAERSEPRNASAATHGARDAARDAAAAAEVVAAEQARAKAADAARAKAAEAARAKAVASAKAKAADAARRKAAVARANRKARAACNAGQACAFLPGVRAGQWIRPMRGDLTSGFGSRWGSMHAGIDLSDGGGSGTPVYAATDGTVVEARCTSSSCAQAGSMSMSGYGNKVDIRHTGDVVTRYAHLKRFVVRTGQKVRAGQLIGFEGATGNVTGPHLHLEVLIGGEAVNPVPFFRRHGVRL
jgi:murein DD-endopeptidase MepM/ murein hydrolase activator NlpD